MNVLYTNMKGIDSSALNAATPGGMLPRRIGEGGTKITGLILSASERP